MIVCVWADSKAEVAKLLEAVPSSGIKPVSVTWRLSGAFDAPVGHACYAPNNSNIEEAYRDAKLRVLRSGETKETEEQTPKPEKTYVVKGKGGKTKK